MTSVNEKELSKCKSMFHTIAISVIVPVFNTDEKVLEECLQSICEQSFNDYEVIIVDDGSTNKSTQTTCDSFASKNSNFSVAHYPNHGVSSARNRGVASAKGRWIAFIDSDDSVEPNYLQSLFEATATSPNSDIAICDCRVSDGTHLFDNHFFPNDSQSLFTTTEEKNLIILQILGQNNYYNPPQIGIGVPWGKLYKKSLLLENNIKFQENLSLLEDNIFNLYAVQLARAICYTPKMLYCYKRHAKSASNKFYPEIVQEFIQVHAATAIFINSFKHDERRLHGYYSRVIQSLHPICRFFFFHEENSLSHAEINSELVQLLNQQCFKESIDSVKFKYLSIKMILFTILVRLHFFGILRILISHE